MYKIFVTSYRLGRKRSTYIQCLVKMVESRWIKYNQYELGGGGGGGGVAGGMAGGGCGGRMGG